MINWNTIIENLKEGEPVTTDPSRWDLSNPEYLKIYKQWEEANFNMDAVKWINYYPGIQFEQGVVDDVAKFLNINVHRAWISRIDPGYFAPWHWDADDNLKEYESAGEVKRYSIFISNPHPAHFFTVDNETFSNSTQGATYKWQDYKAWHAGANAGTIPKYMFHILGY
jgi:hypothetical protein